MVRTVSKKKKSHGWIFFVIILILLLWGLYFSSLYNSWLKFENKTINIEKWDNISKFYHDFWPLQKYMMKLWLRNNAEKVPLIQEGSYKLDWQYSKDDFLEIIAKWPTREYLHVTVLEWWSKYDIDAKLSEMKLIAPWDFVAKTEDQYYINSLKWEYSFLSIIPEWKSLEGFLYPDTYYLEEWVDVKDQLIKAQLKNFEKKVWSQYSSDFEINGLQVSPYGIITLASIIENEEKNKSNKPIIAGIFVNRLNKWMRLDADVTLCYGLWIVYNKCRENIVKNLDDASNLYNTRQNYWLTPTPISSPTQETIDALLNYKKTNAIYYLHDNAWLIHYAETLDKHNENKRIYL